MWDFFKVLTFQHCHYPPPFLQNYYKIFILLFFLFPSTKTNHYFPLQEACGNKYSRLNQNYLRSKKKKPPMIRIRLLKRKRKEVKVDSKLGGQWKVPCLVVNGMLQTWWPMEGEGKTPFHLCHFPSNNLYLNLQFFPLTLRFYFTMYLSRYSRLPCLFFDL